MGVGQQRSDCRYLKLSSTPAGQSGSRGFEASDIHAAIHGRQGDVSALQINSAFTEREMLFIGRRDSFYIASVSGKGSPNLQHRVGAPGFIRAINPKTLIFPDLAGNQRLLTAGKIAVDDPVAMIFTDYAKSRRLRVMGRLTLASLEDAPYLAAELFQPTGESEVERVGSIRVEAFDWSRPRHFTRRYTAAELAPLTRRVTALEAENAVLQAKIARLTGDGA